jgi:hypothetical protein
MDQQDSDIELEAKVRRVVGIALAAAGASLIGHYFAALALHNNSGKAALVFAVGIAVFAAVGIAVCATFLRAQGTNDHRLPMGVVVWLAAAVAIGLVVHAHVNRASAAAISSSVSAPSGSPFTKTLPQHARRVGTFCANGICKKFRLQVQPLAGRGTGDNANAPRVAVVLAFDARDGFYAPVLDSVLHVVSPSDYRYSDARVEMTRPVAFYRRNEGERDFYRSQYLQVVEACGMEWGQFDRGLRCFDPKTETRYVYLFTRTTNSAGGVYAATIKDGNGNVVRSNTLTLNGPPDPLPTWSLPAAGRSASLQQFCVKGICERFELGLETVKRAGKPWRQLVVRVWNGDGHAASVESAFLVETAAHHRLFKLYAGIYSTQRPGRELRLEVLNNLFSRINACATLGSDAGCTEGDWLVYPVMDYSPVNKSDGYSVIVALSDGRGHARLLPVSIDGASTIEWQHPELRNQG